MEERQRSLENLGLTMTGLEAYGGKRVLVTGHTGFKGSWLCTWLEKLGAEVTGIALAPNTEPSHFALLNTRMKSHLLDIRDRDALLHAVKQADPEIVFHLAAQPLVRASYADPYETYTSNVTGTLNVLDACRACDDLRAIVVITTDKVYDNREWEWAYRENDALGGHDPYSSSKACVELLCNSWRMSFFNPAGYGSDHNVLLATTRAGNVVGGGDWAVDRLIPDIVKATVGGEEVEIRNPRATRPWQHVLEPLAGYLQLGVRLINGEREFASAWNFSPDNLEGCDVISVVHSMQAIWPAVHYRIKQDEHAPHEAMLLRLDNAKARTRLGWRPQWNADATFRETIRWYRAWYEERTVLTTQQIEEYERLITQTAEVD